VDESLCAFEHVRWQGKILDLAHANRDQFVAHDTSEETLSPCESSMEITDGDTWQHFEIADQAKNAEEVYAAHERLELLRRAIGCLQPLLRNVVEIHQSNDRSVKEIAELAGISVSATKSRLLRARKALRRAFEREDPRLYSSASQN
jgi:RNA polymerase sigma factor (sigma-70 family)